MMHKTRPHAAVRTAPRFVVNERKRRLKAREITKEQALDQAKAEEAKRHAEVLNGVVNGDDELSPPPSPDKAFPPAPIPMEDLS